MTPKVTGGSLDARQQNKKVTFPQTTSHNSNPSRQNRKSFTFVLGITIFNHLKYNMNLSNRILVWK